LNKAIYRKVCTTFCSGEKCSRIAFGRFLQTASLRYLGKISYGIYLFHLLIQFFFDDYVDKYVLAHYSRSLPKLFQYNLHLLQLPLIILFTVLMAAASFRWIEKPFLQLKAQIVYS